MRVIAGTARRLNLVTPKGMNTRPTSDKVKETLFNMIAPDLYGCIFCDLFAGSGQMGIEALSRGAEHATFIEKDKEALACIKKNLATTHFTEKADVLPYDVLTCLYSIDKTFGIIFMDPPYGQGVEKQVLSILSKTSAADDETLIILETDAKEDMSYVFSLGFEVIKVKQYKNNKHVFLRKSN